MKALNMQATMPYDHPPSQWPARRQVTHLIGLDGRDHGSASIEIEASGVLTVTRTEQPAAGHAHGAALAAVPLLADAHVHLAISDGIEDDARFHTLHHADAQLRHLAECGVGHVLSLGTDQPWLRDRLHARLTGGDPGDKAFGYSAGIGFGAADGWPPELTLPQRRLRPVTADDARARVREAAAAGSMTLKLWVDDLAGTVPKIPRPVSAALLDEARRAGLTTFAHVHDHCDAEALVADGVGVLAHAVRDMPMQPALLDRMARAGTVLVPTLSREEAEMFFSSDENPYMQSAFFRTAEAALWPRLSGQRFSDDPQTPRRRLDIAMANVARAHAAGVAIGMGTDSGFRMKLQGFAQHRELHLLARAGLPPADCLKAALQINKTLFASRMTAIATGTPASFFLVAGNPLADIAALENIREVWVGGKCVACPRRDG